MAQVSYGTITINDITDISDVYLEYGLATSGANVTNIYPFSGLGEIGWSTTYPTWQPGYQIWIREVQEKEGIQQTEYKTPYLDTAVNQINNNYINLNNKIKKIWSNSTGSYMASGIGNNDVNENNVSTYGYNSKSTTTGISFNYNAIPLIEMGILDSGNFSGIKLYSPILTNSTISSSRLDATLTSWGLKLLKGGIESGSLSSGNGYVYLSTEDKTGITINGHNPGNADPKWRAIIGSKFGVDSEGNLYASNASIEGAITATSLTISSNGDSYNAWDAINVTGYSIEIETTEITGSTTTKKLTPHLYHNGANTDTEVTDWTKFIWYRDAESTGITGSSTDGSITGYYGSTYKVTYRFEDGAVSGGTEITTITVQPTDYITDINNSGIKIHPKNHTTGNYIQLDGTGMEVFEIGQTDVSIASFGASGARIGKSNEAHLEMDFNSMQLKDSDGTAYFVAEDARDADGYVTMTYNFTMGSGMIGAVTVDYPIASIVSAKYNGHVVGYSFDVDSTSVMLMDSQDRQIVLVQGDEVVIVYKTIGNLFKSFTFGNRSSNEYGKLTFAEGKDVQASGDFSHAQNLGTIALAKAQTVLGTYNEPDPISYSKRPGDSDVSYGWYALIIGNGSDTNRSNAFEFTWDGDIQMYLENTNDYELISTITALGWTNDVIV